MKLAPEPGIPARTAVVSWFAPKSPDDVKLKDAIGAVAVLVIAAPRNSI